MESYTDTGQIGKAEDGSVTRLSFTKADEAAAFQLTEWMREAGLHVTIDACGNIIGTLKGAEPNLPPVVCGSHFDTVKEGGLFDGCLGVLTVLKYCRPYGKQEYSRSAPSWSLAFGMKKETVSDMA